MATPLGSCLADQRERFSVVHRLPSVCNSAALGIEISIMTGAYAFSCEYSTTGFLLDRLNELGIWKWVQGDSYWYGDYLACRPFPGVRIRIVDFPGRKDEDYIYESDVRISSECTTPMEVIDEAYRKVLEQVPAHDVHEIEWFD
jgi:hypothetical protein